MPIAAVEPGKPVTLRTLRRFVKDGRKFACLTCYDATTARWLERAGVPVLLVGDTAAEMILGQPGTIYAPLDFLITITAAVQRGAPNCFVMGDMPFMSYQADDAEALRNAGRFLTEGMADAVKLEVDRSYTGLIEKMARAGIPVVAHIGSRPQITDRSFDSGRPVLSGPRGRSGRVCVLAAGRQVGMNPRGTAPDGLTTSARDRPARATGGSRAPARKRAHRSRGPSPRRSRNHQC